MAYARATKALSILEQAAAIVSSVTGDLTELREGKARRMQALRVSGELAISVYVPVSAAESAFRLADQTIALGISRGSAALQAGAAEEIVVGWIRGSNRVAIANLRSLRPADAAPIQSEISRVVQLLAQSTADAVPAEVSP